MAKDVEIKIKVVNESGDIIEKTAKSMDDLEQSVASLSKELANAPLGSAKFKELDGALKENQKTLDKTKASTQTFGETLSNIKGPLGGVAQGFMGMGKAALSFVANPIGAVIAALGIVFMAVKKAINNSEEAMDGITKITAIFGGIIRPVMEFIEMVAVAAIDALASGLETLSGWFGVSGKAAADFADALDKQQDTEKDLAVTRAQTNAQLAAAKEILSDTNATYEERVKALNSVKAAEEAQSKLELANTKEKLKLAQDEITLNGASEESIQALRDAKISLANTEQSYAAQQRQFNKQEKSLNSEKAAQEKQAAADAKAIRDKKNSEAKALRDATVAAEKAAKEQTKKYEEEYSLFLIKNEDERAIQALKYRQDRERNNIEEQKNKLQYTKNKTAEQWELFRQYQESLTSLTKLQGQQMAELLATQDKNRLEKKKETDAKILAETEDTYQKEVKYTDDYYKSLNTALVNSNLTEKELKDKQYQLDISRLEEQLATNKTYGKSIVDIEAEIADKKRAHAEEAKKLSEEEYAKKVENAKAFAAVVVESLNSIAALNDQKAANEVNAIKEKYATQLKAAEGDKDATLAIQTQMAVERNKVNKKAFDNNKKLQYATAVINGAVAIGSIIAQYPKFDGGIAMAIALIAATATLGFQLAKIKGTEFVPEDMPSAGGGGGGGDAAKAGSMHARGGYISGPGTGTSDSIPARLSNGESVINANSTAQFGGLLSLINEAGGGKSFAGGGVSNGNMNTPVIKTYVVASEMTSQQEADFRIKQVARL